MGDDIQTIKAGILEIADILVVNKADKPGSDNTLLALRTMLSLSHPDTEEMNHHAELMNIDSPDKESQTTRWIPPILPTNATTGEGIDDLILQISAHHDYLLDSGEWQVRDAARLENDLENLLGSALRSHWEKSISPRAFDKTLSKVISREKSPGSAVEELLKGAGI